jgi:hypothetical protein
LGGGKELGNYRKDATERVQMGRIMGKKRKKKKKSCRGKYNRGKVGIEEKRKEKGVEEGCMVIVAKSEREMKVMMRSLGKYVKKKKLEVNVDKMKMMVFNKRKRKNEESEWKWEESKIERVSEFKYLVYTFNLRATDKVQVREVVRKANKVVGCVWGIGERKWEGEFGRRMMMFESMVESVLMYGAEI